MKLNSRDKLNVHKIFTPVKHPHGFNTKTRDEDQFQIQKSISPLVLNSPSKESSSNSQRNFFSTQISRPINSATSTRTQSVRLHPSHGRWSSFYLA